MIPQDASERLKVRGSMAFFAHPDHDVMVSCVDGSGKYSPINSEQYLNDRLHATYNYIHPTTSRVL